MTSSWHYNEQNGQVYKETIIPAHSMIFKWMQRYSGAKQNPKRYRNEGHGAPALYEMALRSCAWNIDFFAPDALQCAEWSYAGRIYRHLKDRNTLTAEAWRLFETAFPNSDEFDHTYTTRIPCPLPGELESIQQWILSLSFSHLTFLNLQGLHLRRGDLMQLTNIPSLAVLAIRQCPLDPLDGYGDDIDDKFMRDWGRAVQEKGALTRLRGLLIYDTAASVAGILKGLAVFPNLCLCSVRGVHSVRDAHYMRSGEVFDSLPWSHLSAKQVDPKHDPHLIWTRADITIHEKMRLLLDFTNNPCQQPSNTDPNIAVLAIDFGSTTIRSRHEPFWFIRDWSSNSTSAETMKRRDTSVANDGYRMEAASKKRRVRDKKQQDIGSLLGAFN